MAFIRVSVVGAKPVTHITIDEDSFSSSQHRRLKTDPVDRNGQPRPASFAPFTSSDDASETTPASAGQAAPAATTTEAKEAK